MTVYFGSSEDIDFTLINGAVVSTTSGRFDATYARSSIRAYESNKSATVNLPTPLTTLFCTYRFWQTSPGFGGADYPALTIQEGSTGVARINTTNGVWTLQTYDSGWVTRATFSSIPTAATVIKLTLKVVLDGTSGIITAWVGDNEVATWTGDTVGSTGATGLDTLVFTSIDAGPNDYTSISEVVVADEHTINMRVATLVPNADGANTAWTNDYNAVDEITNSTADTLKSPIANQIETMGLSNYGGSSDLVIRTLFVSPRAVKSSGGPQQLQATIRVSTAEYFSSTSAVSTVYATYRKEWATNPYTAADWTIADIDALEAGVKSIA